MACMTRRHRQGVYNFLLCRSDLRRTAGDGVRPSSNSVHAPKLASDPNASSIWYKPNNSPRKTIRSGNALIDAFARHLVERYGIDEARSGTLRSGRAQHRLWTQAHQSTYYELYDHTARALKQINARLRVGGPSPRRQPGPGISSRTASTTTCRSISCPRTSTQRPVSDVSRTTSRCPDQMSARRAQVHDEITASPMPRCRSFSPSTTPVL